MKMKKKSSRMLSLVLALALVLTLLPAMALPAAAAGEPLTYQLRYTRLVNLAVGNPLFSDYVGHASGGTAPYTYSAVGLPAGLKLSSDGLISGTPTAAVSAGSFTVTVTDAASASVSATVGYDAIAAKATVIDRVTANVPMPVAGTDADRQTGMIDYGSYACSINCWYKDNGGHWLGNGFTFEAGEQYWLDVHFYARDGYVFSDTLSGTINGKYYASINTTHFTRDTTLDLYKEKTVLIGPFTAGDAADMPVIDRVDLVGPAPTAGMSQIDFERCHSSQAITVKSDACSIRSSVLYLSDTAGNRIAMNGAALATGNTYALYIGLQCNGACLTRDTVVTYNGREIDNDIDTDSHCTSGTVIYRFTPQASSGLTFTDSSDFDIPDASVSMPITPVPLISGVSGAVRPYTFTASGLPDGLFILPSGSICGIPAKEQSAGDAQIFVRDATGQSRTITIHYGAVGKASFTSGNSLLVSDWTQLKSALETAGSGTVVLANAVTHSSTTDDVLTITGSKTLDLNGFSLTRTMAGTGASSLFYLKGSLHVTDSSSAGTGSIFYDCRGDKAASRFVTGDSSGSFVLSNGAVTSSTDQFYGGSLRVQFRGGRVNSDLLFGADEPSAYYLVGVGIDGGSFHRIVTEHSITLASLIDTSCSVTIDGNLVSHAALSTMKEASNVVVTAQSHTGGAPLIYEAAYPASGVGIEYPAYTPAAENRSAAPTVWSAENLPDGLSIEPGTGRLTGIPTAAGEWSFTLKATNGVGTTTQDCTLHIYSPQAVSDWDAFRSAVESASVSYIQLSGDISHSEVCARDTALLNVAGGKIIDLNGHVLHVSADLPSGFDWNSEAGSTDPVAIAAHFLEASGSRILFSVSAGNSVDMLDSSASAAGRIDFADKTNYFESSAKGSSAWYGMPGMIFRVEGGSLTIRSGSYNAGDSWTHRQHNGIAVFTVGAGSTRILGGSRTGRFAYRAKVVSTDTDSTILPARYADNSDMGGVVSGSNTTICGGTFTGIGGADAVMLDTGSTVYGGTFKTESRDLYKYYGSYSSGIGGEHVTVTVDGRTLPKKSAALIDTKSSLTKLKDGVNVTKAEIAAAAEDNFQSDVKIVPAFPSVFVASQTIHKGVTYTLTAIAAPSGGGALSYQWYGPDFQALTGETKPTLDVRLAGDDTTPDGTILYYYCRVTELPSMLSTETNAALSVSDEKIGPAVTVTPANTTLYYGTEPSSVTLTASVRGGSAGTQGLTYQWYKNGIAIADAVSASCTVNCLNYNSLDNYECAVTDTAGMTASGVGIVTSRRSLEVQIKTQRINGSPGVTMSSPINVGGYLGGSDTVVSISDTTPLPDGLKLEDGAIVGTPTQSGTYALLVTAVLTRFPVATYPEATDTQVVMLYVYDQPEITVAALPDAREGTSYSEQLTLSQGKSGNPIEWSLVNRSRICAGITLGSDGTISGTPDVHDPGTYHFTVKAKDTVTGRSATQDFTLRILGKPGVEYENVYSAADGYKTLSDGTSISFAQGDYGSYFFRLHGSAAGTITFAGLPSGFTFAYDDTLATYVLRGSTDGKVTAAAGSYPVTVTANCGDIGTVAYTLTLVVSSKPIITTSNSDLLTQLGASGSKYSSAVVGQTYSMVIECTSTENIVSWSFKKPTLDKANEDGMTITMDSSNHKKATVTWKAALTQTDSGGSLKDPSSATFSVIATNASGVSSELATYVFDVVGSTKAPTFIALQDEKGNSLSTMSRGMQYGIFNNNNIRVVSDCAPRGYITATGLPEGLTVNNNIYGEQLLSNMKSFISGYTTAPAGVYPVTFTVVNPNTNASYSQTLNLTIIEPQTAPTPVFSLPGGTYSSAQSLQISCSIGVPFYRVEDENGNTLVISDGKIALNDDGTVKKKTLTGEMWQDFDVGNLGTGALYTPLTLDRTVTVYAYTLGSMDTLLNSPVVSQKYIIRSGAASSLHILTGSLPNAKAGAAYSAQLNAVESGVSWSASGLPAGLSVNAATGEISGIPAASGSYQVTVTAASAAGGSGVNPAQTVFTLTVADKDAQTSAAPTVKVSPLDSAINQHSAGLTLTAAVTGNNGGAVLVTWYASDKAGSVGHAVSVGYGYTASAEYVGTVYYTPVVTNTEPGYAASTVTGPTAKVTVNANAQTPEFDLSAVRSVDCPSDKTCSLEAFASVSDGGALTYTWWKMAGSSPGSSDTCVGWEEELTAAPEGSAGSAKYYVVATNTNSAVAGVKTATATSPVYTVTYTAPAGVTVSGSVRSFGSDATAKTTVRFILNGTSETAYETTAAGTGDKPYSISGVAAGTYTVRVMKTNHVTREYTVTVSDTNVTQNAEIWLLGDINGDGKVNTKDWNGIKRHVNETELLSGYALSCADVSGDGKVTTKDWNRVKRHVNETELLW